jgi:phosphonate transport system substrate-binding protein
MDGKRLGPRRAVLTAMLTGALLSSACSEREKTSPPEQSGAGGSTAESQASTKTVRVTGIPDENPTELARKYEPMVKYLESKLGTKVEYVPVTDYGAAVQALSAGKVDFAWLGGFTHVQARVMTGAVPLCMRDIDREFKSVFIASKQSGITAPEQLKGKSFAFGSKSSTSGHLMPRHFLVNQLHIDPEKDFDGSPVYSGAHDATVKMVESGKVQSGALNIEVWDRLLKENKVDLEKVAVIWTTPPYVDYVWTASKDIDPGLRDRFKAAFLELDASKPEHAAVLELQGAKKFVPAAPADFDQLEKVARGVDLLK